MQNERNWLLFVDKTAWLYINIIMRLYNIANIVFFIRRYWTQIL